MFKRNLLKKSVVVVASLLVVGAVAVGLKNCPKAASLNMRLDSNNAKITMVNPGYEYTGNAVKPSYKVYYKSNLLKEGKDYTASYSNNVEPGTATVTVTGKGNYAGKKSAKYMINQKPSKIKFEGEQFFAIAATGKYLIEPMANDYLTNPNAITYVDGGIGEAFMLFPKRNDVKFTVQRVALDANLTQTETIAKDVKGAVVIYCDPVEYAPHLQVVAICDGKKVTLPLSYSGIDGRINIPSTKYVKDVTP